MKKCYLAGCVFILLLSGSLNGFAQSSEALKSSELNEVSGLIVTRNNTIYVHNDSGDTTRFFAINAKGDLLSTIYFKGDPVRKSKGVLDCEDIAYGPGPEIGRNYIYLGDIGDNSSLRSYISVYRFPEPSKLETTMHTERELIHFRYPNGAQDAETMMVDPVSKELVIVSKRQDTVGIYAASLSFRDGDTIQLQKRGSLYLPSGLTPSSKYIVAGDISFDGKQVLLKTYQKVYYWGRKNNEPLTDALLRKPVALPYVRERQGEAIGFSSDGKGYYCISEGLNALVYYYKIEKKLRKHASR